MTTIEHPLDEQKLQGFQQRTVGRYADANVVLMIALGHRTGLFEAASTGSATSQELAERAGLSPRHVQEWLGAVTCAGIFDHDPVTDRYTLPAEHAFWLTGDTAENLAVMSPMIVHLAGHVETVADRFRTGGGVPYEAYRPGFTGAMDELNRRQYDALLLDSYLPLAEGLVDRLESGARVADIGCGTGHTTNLMAHRFPTSTFVGYDLADDALTRGRDEAAELGLTNVSFETRDVVHLPTDPSFDAIFAFDAIHDQVDPAGALACAADALAPDGILYMVDIKASSNLDDNVANPLGPMLYTVSTLHCMEVSLAEGGAGLGTVWGEQCASRMLSDAGFATVETFDLEGDPFNVVYVARPGG